MDINGITTLISSIGFPIVACCAMGYYITKELHEMQENMQELTLTIKELNVKLANGAGGDIINEDIHTED
jgi:hypothetical protein